MIEVIFAPIFIFVAIKLMSWINRQVGIDPKLVDPRDLNIQIKELKFKLKEAENYGPEIELPQVFHYNIEPAKFHCQFAISEREILERGPRWIDAKIRRSKEDFLMDDAIKPFIKHESRKSDYSHEEIHRLTLWVVPIPEEI